MEFSTFIAQAWADHVQSPQQVAERVGPGAALVTDEGQFIQLADLVHHLYGDHLNDRAAGLRALEHLTHHAAYRPHGMSGAAMRRFNASLQLSQGVPSGIDAFGISDRIRIMALAISNLSDTDRPRATALLHQARQLAELARLPPADSMHAELAREAHNLAVGIERDPASSAADLATMVLAAQTAEQHWGLLGDPEGVFDGAYRMACAWRRLGNAVPAREAAMRCLDMALARGGTPRQLFLSAQLLALLKHDAGERHALAHVANLAHAAYAEMDGCDQTRQQARLAQLADLGEVVPSFAG